MRFATLVRTRARLLLGLTLGVLGITGAGYALTAATTVTSRISASMASAQTSSLAQGTASYAPTITFTSALTNGSGTGQFLIVYADSGTIAASDSVTKDFSGVLLDAFGATISCATLKALIVTAPATNTNNVLVGGGTVGQIQFLADTTDAVPVKPGGVFLWEAPATGATVTNTTRDKMRIKNSGAGTTVKYTLQALCA